MVVEITNYVGKNEEIGMDGWVSTRPGRKKQAVAQMRGTDIGERNCDRWSSIRKAWKASVDWFAKASATLNHFRIKDRSRIGDRAEK